MESSNRYPNDGQFSCDEAFRRKIVFKFFSILLCLFLWACDSKNQVISKGFDLEKNIRLEFFENQKIVKINYDPKKCFIVEPFGVPCDPKRVRELISILNKLEWEKPEKTVSLSGKQSRLLYLRQNQLILKGQLYVLNIPHDYLIYTQEIDGQSSRAAGYIKKGSFKKLRWQGLRFKKLQLPFSDHEVYLFKDNRRILVEKKGLKELKNMFNSWEFIGYKYTGVVEGSKKKELFIGERRNNNFYGSLVFQKEGKSLVYQFGRPEEANLSTYIWQEGSHEVIEGTFRAWPQFLKFVDKHFKKYN